MLSNPNTYAMPGFNQTAGNLPIGPSPLVAGPTTTYAGPTTMSPGGTMMFPPVPGTGYPDYSTPINVSGSNVFVGGGYPAAQPLQYPVVLPYPQQQNNTDINNVVNVLINILNQVQTQPAPQPAPQQQDGNFMFLLLALLLKGDIGGGGKRHTREGGTTTGGGTTTTGPKPRVTTDTVETTATTTGGRVWGDPHFVDFEGGKYDVMGEVGKVYNILSDSNIQFNAKFDAYKGQKDATIISEAGLKLGKPETGITQVQFSRGGKAPIVNGQELQKGEKITFDSGLTSEDGRPILGSVTWDGKAMTVNSGEYITKLTNQGEYLDHDVTITNLGIRSDGVNPHGLLGQNADGQVDNGKQGKGAQGEGAIAGVYTDYEVQGLFEDGFQFNKFGGPADQAAEFGVLAGKAGKTT